MSALGEPLKAEVELVAEKNEIGSLSVRLANREAFERAGLTYSSAVSAIKATVEKRTSGEPYVQLVSTQPITEPFVDLLLELTWSTGRISREFTALLDPPAVIAERQRQKAAAPEVRAAPATPQANAVPVPPPAETPKPQAPNAEAPAPEASKPEVPQPAAEKAEAPAATSSQPPAEAAPAPPPASVSVAPVETIGGSQPTLLGEGSALPSRMQQSADAYGPVRSGDTLGKIALATKPAEFTLEQMLVLLTRNNPEAFSGKNMNRLKTGKILHFPTSDELASLSPAEATKEVKLQARDWRAYREQLAASSAQGMPADQQAQQSAAGKVGASTPDKPTSPNEQPKEVLKLSKNEPAAGTPGGDAKASARIRALEEEVVAREKAVKESDSRVAKLEKQVKDLQALLEMKSKSMANQQKPSTMPPAGAVAQTPANSPPQVPAAPPPGATSAATSPATPTPASPGPKNESAPAPAQPQPAPPKPAAPKTLPAPVPEASLMDQVMDQPAYLGAAIGVLIIIGALAVRAVKRRRESKSDAEESGPARAVAAGSSEPYVGAAAANTGDSSHEITKTSSEEVDPVAEAEIFLAYGRDTQAEELLKEALENSPGRHEIRLKLLQIYAGRKDAKSFEKVARDLQQATGGTGPIWEQAVALGYQVDPDNARYASGKSAVASPTPIAGPSTAENVDFNIGYDDAAVTPTDIDLGDTDSSFARTQIIDPGQDHAGSMEPAATTMDFNVDLPPVEQTAADTAPAAQPDSSGIDFDINLNAMASGPDTGNASGQPSTEPGLDFDMSEPSGPATGSAASAPDIDLSGISLDLGTDTSPTGSPSGKDDHWYDVQTKFDLAKAYQEMGDKDGAREILKEVLAEGDAEQQTAANSVLATLDS